jgi:hypothetical protein
VDFLQETYKQLGWEKPKHRETTCIFEVPIDPLDEKAMEEWIAQSEERRVSLPDERLEADLAWVEEERLKMGVSV